MNPERLALTELAVWSNEWEETHSYQQLDHIRIDPNMKCIVGMGKVVIPFVLEKLLNNRLRYIPMEEIIRAEFGEDVKVKYKEGESEAISRGRYTNTEGHREACQRWAEENREKYL